MEAFVRSEKEKIELYDISDGPFERQKVARTISIKAQVLVKKEKEKGIDPMRREAISLFFVIS
ncbi:hypothetical protein GCM10007390_19390 [Persicitalea jodogahamensis]|uniref:Uncharacterized protein n=1 Tax=Persicitalea jodogahamensis TaxID=402147 RepID=A0A8J3G8F8_9BACT|nr:hypothetical protein GCM10007390_19390 [Persicitalea jodogahamensis]